VNTGPEGAYLGGYYEAIAIHPKSPQVVYASTYYGLFRSTDGGATWQRRPAPPWLSQVALDPADPQTLYALASGALYRTTSAGASWVELPRPHTDVHLNPILVTVSPSSPQTIYLVSYSGGVSDSGDDPGVPVFSSADAGRTWAQVGRIEAVGRYQPAAILVDPRSPRTVHVWVWLKGIFRSEDGGATWTKANASLPIGKLSSVAAHPTRSGVLYAGSERGDVFRSLDAGATWRAVARGLDGDVTDIAVSAADGAVYAGTSPPYREDGVEIGGGTVYRSADGRAPWRARSDGLTGWNVRALVAHPRTPGRLLAGTEHGIFGTRNGGASWVESVTGLVASSPTGLAVDPATAGAVFATVERGMAVSRDGGRTWETALDLRGERADVGLPLAVPGTPVTLYTVKRSHAAPKPRSILLASRDAGRTWVEVGALPHSVPLGAALVGDPTDANTLYFVARGIFKSVDGGLTWTRIYSAVRKPPVGALAVDPFDSSVLYALVRGRLRMTEDGGRTWRQLPGIPQAGIWQFALDPHRRGTVYAVTGGWVNLVYVSKDRGATWSKLGKPPIDASTLLVDPVRPGVVYAGTTNGVYVKRPGATTWQAVGPARRHVRLLATDVKGRRLYAGIEGGGVAATRLPMPTAGIRRSAFSSHSSAKPGARSASRAAGLIAFTRPDGIYVMNADGTGVRPLRRGPVASRAFELDWSPDGRRLAFEEFPGGAIWVMGADGKGLTRVVAPGGDWGSAHSPTWSPDGRRLAFSAERAREIWVVDADGSDAHRLLRLPKLGADMGVSAIGVGEIDWSPDGRRIVFAAHSGWFAYVYVVNVNGSGLRRLTDRGWAWATDPEWSPDGRRIVFEQTFPSNRIGPNTSEIYVIGVDSGSQVRLIRNGVPDTSPTWSSDGRIAFVRSEPCPSCPLRPSGDAREIFVVNADGTGVTRLTHNRVGEARPAWQPVAPAEG
jgi:Tol biopolymer transport system component/photosystem II stability/assembly factor-like uncharacterized protein